jgi:hypothetical protein
MLLLMLAVSFGFGSAAQAQSSDPDATTLNFLQQVATIEFTQRLLLKLSERCEGSAPLDDIDMEEVRMVVKDKSTLSYLEILRVYIDNGSVREKIEQTLRVLDECKSLDFKMYRHSRLLEFKQAKQGLIDSPKVKLAGD